MKGMFTQKVGLAVLATFALFLIVAPDDITESSMAQVKPTVSAIILPSHNRPQAIDSATSATAAPSRAQAAGSLVEKAPSAAPIFLSICVLRR